MTDDALAVNGRVTQRDLYDAITRIDTKLDRHYASFDRRLLRLEEAVHRDQGHDEAQATIVAKQDEQLREQGVSRRWLVTIAVTVVLSLMATLVSVYVALAA